MTNPQRLRHTKLYDILGVKPTATPAEITKGYRIRALKVHPDKNKEEDTHEHFQQLQRAYEVLKNLETRQSYDADGSEEEECEAFEKAYDYYRRLYPKIYLKDIDEFATLYKDSEMEKEDLMDFYMKMRGDIAMLLEYIPLSEADGVERYISIIDDLLKEERLKRTKKYSKSIERLRKNAVIYQKKTKKELKQSAKMRLKHENSGVAPEVESLGALCVALKGNRVRRAAESASWLDSLENRYKPKKLLKGAIKK